MNLKICFIFTVVINCLYSVKIRVSGTNFSNPEFRIEILLLESACAAQATHFHAGNTVNSC